MKLFRHYIEWSVDTAEEMCPGPGLWVALVAVWLWTLLVAALMAIVIATFMAACWWLSTLAFWVGPVIVVIGIVIVRQTIPLIKESKESTS